MDELSNLKRAFEKEHVARLRAEKTLEERTNDLLLIQKTLYENYDEMRRNLTESTLIFSLGRLARTNFKIHDAFSLFIEGVCKLHNWQIGHIYQISSDALTDRRYLVSRSIWYLSDPTQFFPFKDITEKVIIDDRQLEAHYHPIQGIPAMIDDENRKRLQVLKSLGFVDSLSVPITCYGKVLAIAEFFSQKEMPKEKYLIDTMATMTNQLAIVLEHQQSERKLKKNYEELERVYKALKSTQTQLLQKSTMASIGQLAAGVAHEINTPIQYIGDNSRFLIDSFNDLITIFKENKNINTAGIDVEYLFKEIPIAIQQTLEGIEHVSEIVKAMKEFSHPGSVEKTPTDLNRSLLYTITVAKNEWKYIAELKTSFDHDLPMVWCQPNEMNQVFLNLLSNACHAIEAKYGKEQNEKGHIEVSTKRDGDYAVIVIQDDGIGIADSIKSRVYEPFFTTKEVGKGTGQGLSIVHSIVVQKHQGTVSFESVEGEGATFTVRIPIKSISSENKN